MTTDDARIRDYVAGLPDASGTFTGTFEPDAVAGLFDSVPDLLPIEVDTGDQPNPAAGFLTVLTIRSGDEEWTLPVDHVDLLGGNRARVWVRRPAVLDPGAAEFPGDGALDGGVEVDGRLPAEMPEP